MHKYEIKFAHENEFAESDEERHGAGMIEIETDHKIETREDLVEVARTIGKKNGYTKVALTSVLEMIEKDEDASNED